MLFSMVLVMLGTPILASTLITTPPPQLWYYSWYMILIYLNAILGIIIFEFYYRGVRRHMAFEELHAQFPLLRRFDAHLWARWKFWPSAATVMIPRMILSIIFFLVMWIGVCILLIGHQEGKPYSGCRRFLI